MARAPWSVVVVAGIFLSCAGTLADPSVKDDSLKDDSGAVDPAQVSPEASSKHGLNGSAVIATLRTRDSELTILSEGGGLRYSLVDAVGVAKSLTLDELRAYDANLFEFVKSATARSAPSIAAARGWGIAPRPAAVSCTPGDPCRGAAFIDARVEPPPRASIPGLPAFAVPIGADHGPAGAARALGTPRRD
jgi:hypothetical protein